MRRNGKWQFGVIGLGDTSSGLAKNLIGNGFETWSFDLDQRRLNAFATMGGKVATDTVEVGQYVDFGFVTVMTGG